MCRWPAKKTSHFDLVNQKLDHSKYYAKISWRVRILHIFHICYRRQHSLLAVLGFETSVRLWTSMWSNKYVHVSLWLLVPWALSAKKQTYFAAFICFLCPWLRSHAKYYAIKCAQHTIGYSCMGNARIVSVQAQIDANDTEWTNKFESKLCDDFEVFISLSRGHVFCENRIFGVCWISA